MKKLLLPLLLFPIVATSQSNQSTDSGFFADTKIVCVSGEVFFKSINEYGEQPMLTMNSRRIIQNDRVQESRQYPTVLFANPSTGSWTLVERQDENLYCVVGLGDNLKPYR